MVACDFLWHSCIFVLVWQARILASSLPQTERCPKLLKEFADVVSNYTYCAVRNSRPFRFCCACEEAYMTALHGYRHIVLDEGCHDDLVMAEKYQIVEAAYNFVVHLWESSNCPGMSDEEMIMKVTSLVSTTFVEAFEKPGQMKLKHI